MQGFFDVWLPRVGWMGMISVCGFVLRAIWNGRGFLDSLRADWTDLKEKADSTHQILSTATTNHLSHIETGVEALNSSVKEGFERLEGAINRASDRSADEVREARSLIRTTKPKRK